MSFARYCTTVPKFPGLKIIRSSVVILSACCRHTASDLGRKGTSINGNGNDLVEVENLRHAPIPSGHAGLYCLPGVLGHVVPPH